jgi:hypothetical protein
MREPWEFDDSNENNFEPLLNLDVGLRGPLENKEFFTFLATAAPYTSDLYDALVRQADTGWAYTLLFEKEKNWTLKYKTNAHALTHFILTKAQFKKNLLEDTRIFKTIINGLFEKDYTKKTSFEDIKHTLEKIQKIADFNQEQQKIILTVLNSITDKTLISSLNPYVLPLCKEALSSVEVTEQEEKSVFSLRRA